MFAIVKTMLLQIWKEILVYGAIAGGVLLVMMKLRDGGRQAERNESLKKTVEAVKVKNEIRHNVSGADDAERQRLRNKWTKRD